MKKLMAVVAACLALMGCNQNDGTKDKVISGVSSQMGYMTGVADATLCHTQSLIVAKIMINGGPEARGSDLDYSNQAVIDLLERSKTYPVSPVHAAKQHFEACIETASKSFAKTTK